MKIYEKPDVKLLIGTLRRYRMNLRTKKSVLLKYPMLALNSREFTMLDTIQKEIMDIRMELVYTPKRGYFYNSLVKINTQNGDATYWHSEGCYPGEPCFIPSPDSKDDQDGILLSIVLDTLHGNSFLMLLDASTMQEIARATVPEPVVFGFHGKFFAGN